MKILSSRDRSEKHVVFVSSPTEVVEEFLQALQKVRVKPTIISTELGSISRAILQEEDSGQYPI